MITRFFIMLATEVNGIFPWLQSHEEADFGVFLRIGSFEVRWYAIMILLGAYMALLKGRYELKRRKMPEDYFDNFILSCLPISLIGARAWYVISEWDKKFYNADFIDIIATWNGGLAIQGGILFGVIWGLIYYTKIHKRYPFGLLFDIALPTIALGQAIGRWGNFFNGEVYGKIVDRETLWWIPKFAIDYCTGVGTLSQVGQSQVHIPLFYVECVTNLLGFVLTGIVLWNFWKKGRKPLQIGALYIMWYGVTRLLLEPLRDSRYIMGDQTFGSSMIMSIIYIVVGALIFIYALVRYFKVPFEKIYINEAAELLEKEKEEAHEKELQAKIEAKKAEIRARKAKESKNG